MSDLVICKFLKSIIIHDTECPYWDQVSLNNTKPHPHRYCFERSVIQVSIFSATSEVRVFVQFKNKYIESNNDGEVSNPTSVRDCVEKCLDQVGKGS